jgi:voltage-dependent calcium channel
VDVLVRLFGLGWRSFRGNGWNLFDIVIAAGSFHSTIIAFVNNEVGYYTSQLQKLFLVAMGFKLVQRVDSLNKLFKTAR